MAGNVGVLIEKCRKHFRGNCMSIMSLLNQVREGDIVLPAIQRNFVWEETQINKLLDSIMRGYPIGIALLWETYEDIQSRPFICDYREGNHYKFKENSQKRKLKLVLDGQQRLQSLYVALYGTYKGKYLCFDILSGHDSDHSSEEKYLFDFLTSKEMKQENTEAANSEPEEEGAKSSPADIPYYLKVCDLFSMDTKARKKLRKDVCNSLNLDDDADDLIEYNLTRFDEVLTKDNNILKTLIIDENLPSDSPSRKTEADILEIFVRINREGTPLNRSDLIFSMLKLNWKESADALPEFVDSVNKGNSLSITTDFVIRCLYAVSDLGTKLDIDLLRNKNNVEKIKQNFSTCCSAIKSMADFALQECWCSNSKILGGLNSLVPLVYYLHYQDKYLAPQREIQNIRKAVYLFGFSMVFSRYADSRLGKFIKEELRTRKTEQSKEFPYEAVIWWVKYWEGYEAFDQKLLQKNHRLTLHVLQQHHGTKAFLKANAPEVDHIFPRSELRKKGFNEEEINHYANFWLLSKNKNQNKSNKHPKKFFVDVNDTDLERAFIERDMLDYRKYRNFIKDRSEKILAHVIKQLGVEDSDFEFKE
ncbi:MAG TPA: DUF262 domain-containing protein [Nitrospirae bacterium]|nr:DUF262 domain-containing protein [Nitrospirota bacterium]